MIVVAAVLICEKLTDFTSSGVAGGPVRIGYHGCISSRTDELVQTRHTSDLGQLRQTGSSQHWILSKCTISLYVLYILYVLVYNVCTIPQVYIHSLSIAIYQSVHIKFNLIVHNIILHIINVLHHSMLILHHYPHSIIGSRYMEHYVQTEMFMNIAFSSHFVIRVI